MSDYTDLSAADLAGCLRTARSVLHATGSLSQLDEATLAYGDLSPELGQAQRAFAEARYRHMRSWNTARQSYSGEAWKHAADAAEALAGLLEPLGAYVLPRCKRPSAHGTCNMPLRDGECRSSLGHTDGKG